MRAVIAVLALAACGSKKDSDDKSAPPPTLSKVDKLSVSVGGKAIAMGRAFVKRVSPDHWRLLVSDREGSCDELLSGVTTSQGGATTFMATVRTLLAPDGTQATKVTELWFAGKPVEVGDGVAAQVAADVAKGKKVDVTLGKLVHPPLAIDGSFVAEGCGDQQVLAGVPTTQHVSAATLVIAGKPVELHGAALHGSEIVLSTGPKDCSSTLPFAQVVLEFKDGAWELAGTWIPPGTPQDAAMKNVKLAVGATGTSADGPTAAVKLAGTGTIGGYSLGFSGTIEALDCPDR